MLEIVGLSNKSFKLECAVITDVFFSPVSLVYNKNAQHK